MVLSICDCTVHGFGGEPASHHAFVVALLRVMSKNHTILHSQPIFMFWAFDPRCPGFDCRSVLSCSHTLVDFTLLQVIVLQSDFRIRESPNIIHAGGPEGSELDFQNQSIYPSMYTPKASDNISQEKSRRSGPGF